jgi:RNA polymerase sigma-70 factor, ECF subfamily
VVLSWLLHQTIPILEVFYNFFFSFFFGEFHETNQTGPLSNDERRPSDTFDEDHPLVSASRNGNTDAFEKLVKKHQARMMNIAYRMTGNYDDACETVQEAFLSAYRSIKKFRGEAMFSTWLYGICINHAKNRISQNQRRGFHEVASIDNDSHDSEDYSSPEPIDSQPSAVEQLERKALQDKVQKSINKLEKGQKQVLVLRDIEGFSYEEIGDILKLPEGTIKSRLFRARDAIKTSLKGIHEDY